MMESHDQGEERSCSYTKLPISKCGPPLFIAFYLFISDTFDLLCEATSPLTILLPAPDNYSTSPFQTIHFGNPQHTLL